MDLKNDSCEEGWAGAGEAVEELDCTLRVLFVFVVILSLEDAVTDADTVAFVGLGVVVLVDVPFVKTV